MMHAYDDTLLGKARITLARMYDYGVNDYGLPLCVFHAAFLNSPVSKAFQEGDSRTIAGHSGTELAFEILRETIRDCVLPEPSMGLERTPEYWLGYNLSYYQWYRNIPFARITENIKINEILRLYPTYHEMDVMQFVDHLDEYCMKDLAAKRLKRLRAYAEMSQSQLAAASGIPVRTIQQYEQGQKKLEKASFETIRALSQALKCNLDDM